MRTPLIAGNWKMFKTVSEAVAFAKEFKAVVKDVQGVDIVLAPTFIAVHAVAEAVRATNVAVAAQDVYWEKEGAFTGEVSAGMLADFGCRYVIVGHSERRTLFGDTDKVVAAKYAAVLKAGLTPIVCLGETLQERESGVMEKVIARQLDAVITQNGAASLAQAVLAYEPVWAIGTGLTATPDQAQEVHRFIRRKLAELLGSGADIRIL